MFESFRALTGGLGYPHLFMVPALTCVLLALATLVVAAAPSTLDCDVTIVGAGVAGLSAAAHLHTHAPTRTVCLLEGRDRVGGRVHSVPSRTHPGIVFEMGASWIHGIEHNPIFALAQAFNISTVPTRHNGRLRNCSETSASPGKGDLFIHFSPHK